ncbi:hypothetical protein ACLOJK_011505 [Asimina triloba]
MADWAPVIIGVVLFVLLSPGLLFQLPGNNRPVDFGSMKTNGKAVAIHTLIFFAVLRHPHLGGACPRLYRLIR